MMRRIRSWVCVIGLVAASTGAGCGVIGGGGKGFDCDVDTIADFMRGKSGDSESEQAEIRDKVLDECGGEGATLLEGACADLRADEARLEGPIEGMCPA